MENYYENKIPELLNRETLLKNTIFSNETSAKEIVDMIRENTEDIDMGSTSNKNLDACCAFLYNHDIETSDRSMAIDITTVRVLKMLPGIFEISQLKNKEYAKELFINLTNQYVLKREDSYLREKISEDATVDQIMRESGSAINIQRHITIQEMGKVLKYVKNIYSDYSQLI